MMMSNSHVYSNKVYVLLRRNFSRWVCVCVLWQDVCDVRAHWLLYSWVRAFEIFREKECERERDYSEFFLFCHHYRRPRKKNQIFSCRWSNWINKIQSSNCCIADSKLQIDWEKERWSTEGGLIESLYVHKIQSNQEGFFNKNHSFYSHSLLNES